MKQKILLWQLMGFAVTSLLGTLLHFLYDLLFGASWIAPFSGVNESTFEHMKLLFWPMLLFAAVEAPFFRERADFICIKARGVLLGLVLIPVLFYTYNGVIGQSPDFVNITIFFLSAAAAYLYEGRLLSRKETACRRPLALLLLVTLAALFVLFTFRPPMLGLFRDPMSGGFGIPA